MINEVEKRIKKQHSIVNTAFYEIGQDEMKHRGSGPRNMRMFTHNSSSLLTDFVLLFQNGRITQGACFVLVSFLLSSSTFLK